MSRIIKISWMGTILTLEVDDDLPPGTLLARRKDGTVMAEVDIDKGEVIKVINDDGSFVQSVKDRRIDSD